MKHRETILAIVLAVLLLLLTACGPVEQPVARGSSNYGWLREEQIVVTASGTAGAASGSQESDGAIRGHVYAMHLDYAPSISTTTDMTLALGSPALTVLSLSDNYTDAWYYPAVQQTGSSGSGTSTYDRLPISGRLTATVAETAATTVLTVTVWWGE